MWPGALTKGPAAGAAAVGKKDLRPLVIEALEKAERTDLIGYEEKCLIRPQKGEKYFGKKPEEPTRPDRREKPRGGNFRHKRPENPGQKGKMPQRKKEAFAKRRKSEMNQARRFLRAAAGRG